MYCLETCKASAAWGFVATASHMSQTLGMHSKVEMAQDPPKVKAVKIKLLWLLYVQEKGLSLRLGRSSTIRDSDITIPVPCIDSLPEISYFSQLDKMKDLAQLKGKIYDQLYSSSALTQPQDIRTSRARYLVAELEVHMNREGRSEVWQPKHFVY
jgi:amidase